MPRKLTIDDFFKRANAVHNGKYDYSHVDLKNATTKVSIVCPIHGEFSQQPMAHMKGQGCPKCAGRGLNTSEIVDLFKKVHGDLYDYSNVVYDGANKVVDIICPKHGKFRQSPRHHLRGEGCRKCGIERMAKKNVIEKEEFIRRARLIHGKKYDYSFVQYNTLRNCIEIICPKHGRFRQIGYDHLNGHGCERCANMVSAAENEIFDFVHNECGCDDAVQRDRNVLDGKELDIYVPSKHFAIEYDGLIWHSEKFGKDTIYHLSKTTECEKRGIHLIHVFEDEWLNKKEIVKCIVMQNLYENEDINEDGTVVKLSRKRANDFFDKNGIDGHKPFSVCYGRLYRREIVCAASFKHIRNTNEWIVNNYATNIHHMNDSSMKTVFSWFVKKHNPSSVVSYADRRWFSKLKENIFTNWGFVLRDIKLPAFYYTNDLTAERIDPFHFDKEHLVERYEKRDLNTNMRRSEFIKRLSLFKIWNCGYLVYQFINV